MKINYSQNPLATSVELDEQEIDQLRLKVTIEQLREIIHQVNVELSTSKNVEATAKHLLKTELSMDYLYDEGEDSLNSMIDFQVEQLVKELKSGHHCGDCTSVPCSCVKCYAEELLEIDTIFGLSKNAAHYIFSVFSTWDASTQTNGPAVSIDEALEKLRTYNLIPGDPEAWKKHGGYEQFLPDWQKNLNYAYEWLTAYKSNHM